MKRLYLLRHGQTEFNVKKLVQGRCDSPLTDLGRKQAGMAAAWLKAHGVVPDKVVSSPLGRAMDTAQLVACELLGPDTAVEPCEGIIERSYGTFEEGPHDALPTRRLGPRRGPDPIWRQKEAMPCRSAWWAPSPISWAPRASKPS